MKSTKTVEIAIFPHLKKFILKHYKIEPGEPVYVSMHNTLGITMKHVLKEKVKISNRHQNRLTEKITLELCKSLSGRELRRSYLLQFNIEYDRVFKDFYRVWVTGMTTEKVPESEAIKRFLEYYNIKETEYSYLSAQRDWSRFKNKEYERE